MHLVLYKRTESPMGSQEASTNRTAGSAGARAGVRRKSLLAALGVIQGGIDITVPLVTTVASKSMPCSALEAFTGVSALEVQ
jgi:hypothetical protein